MPSRQGANWESEYAACGIHKPGFLDERDNWFSNLTLVECANRLLQAATMTRNLNDFIYIVVVSNPINVTVLPPTSVYDIALPDSPYRAFEYLLSRYSPPVAGARRSDEPNHVRFVDIVDQGLDLTFGMVAVRTSLVDLFFPFREARSWTASVCIFWATARALFSSTMVRFNRVRAGGGGDLVSVFTRLHYSGDGIILDWAGECEEWSMWVMAGLASPSAIRELLGGTASWMSEERAARSALQSSWSDTGYTLDLSLFDPLHPLVCGHVTYKNDSSSCNKSLPSPILWKAVISAFSAEVQSRKLVLEESRNALLSILGREQKHFRVPHFNPQKSPSFLEKQARVSRLSERKGRWENGREAWVVEDEGGQEYKFKAVGGSEYYCPKLAAFFPLKVCVLGDSITRSPLCFFWKRTQSLLYHVEV